MGIGRKRGPGGGGASLNFAVKAYSSEAELLAAVPKENTIGIITTAPITSWIFSTTEPEAYAEGMVWISTGISSDVEFNALKKNSLQVYPISAHQYINGAWVDVTAKSYQGGEWVSWWDGTLYDAGDQCTDFTGGWKAVKGPSSSISFGSSNITISNASKGADGTVYTKNKIDLSSFNTMRVECTISNIWKLTVGVSSENTEVSPTKMIAGTEFAANDNNGVFEVDISAVDSGYPFVFSNETDVKITKVRLK